MEENEPASPGMQGSERVPPIPPPPLPVAGAAPVFVPPPPPPGKGRGWKVVALIALAFLAVSLLYNLSYMAGEFVSGPSANSTSGPKLEELVVEHAKVSDRVAVIKIEGMITSDSSDGFNLVDVIQAQLDRAEADSRVKAVVLKVDSPGGEVLASDDIYRAIEKFQEDSGKPVVAAMGNLAASGGYYVSAPCRWIVANEMTLTGSIGVIMHSLNYRGLMNKVGLQPFVYKSGKYKDMLSGTRDPSDVSEEERRMVQSLIDEVYVKFKQAVLNGRRQAREANRENEDKGRALAADWAEYADGRVFSGTEAYKLGFVDQLGNFEDAVARARTLAGIEEASVVEYQLQYKLSDLFRLFSKSEARTIKLEMGMDWPKIQAGRLYFLSSTLAQ